MKRKNKQTSVKLLWCKETTNSKAKGNVEIRLIKKPIKPSIGWYSWDVSTPELG